MKCLFCPLIQDELLTRLNDYIRFYNTIPCKDDAWDSILSCECDKIGSLIGFEQCEECNSYVGITEEEWEDWCNINGFPYRIADFDSVKENNKDIQDNILHNMQDHEEDIPLVEAPKPTKKQIKRNRKERYQNHLKQIQEKGKYWISGIWPVDKNGDYVRDDSPEFVRFKRGYRGKRSKYIKRHCNKRIRRKDNFPLKGNGYRKASEFWWELW